MLGRGAGAGDAAPIGALSLHVAMSGRTRPGIGLGESGSGTTGSGRSSGLMSSAPLRGFLGWMRAGGMRAGRTQLGDFEDDVVDETRGVCGAALPRRRGLLFLRSVRSTPLTDRPVAKSTGESLDQARGSRPLNDWKQKHLTLDLAAVTAGGRAGGGFGCCWLVGGGGGWFGTRPLQILRSIACQGAQHKLESGSRPDRWAESVGAQAWSSNGLVVAVSHARLLPWSSRLGSVGEEGCEGTSAFG